MKPKDLIVIVALNSSVAALLRSSGKMLWQTDLPGVLGNPFVTLAADETQVYALTKGQLHCLDLKTGRILWTNELKGLGYGIASLCVPGSPPSAPEPAVHAEMEHAKRKES